MGIAVASLLSSEDFGVLGNLLGQVSVIADDQDSVASVHQFSA